MKSKLMKRLTVICCLVVLLLSMTAPAFAANVCSTVGGNANGTVTFTVNTKSRFFGDKITLKQKKGIAVFDGWRNNKPEKQVNWGYTITVKKIDGGTKKADQRTIDWTGGSKTINLQKNAVYEITVTPYNSSYIIRHALKGSFDYWKKVPSWSISKTKGVSFCRL